MHTPPYLGEVWDESVTAKETPETEPETLDTGLVDQYGRPIKRRSQRVKMGFVP